LVVHVDLLLLLEERSDFILRVRGTFGDEISEFVNHLDDAQGMVWRVQELATDFALDLFADVGHAIKRKRAAL
jgi:hypothetical protein